jgi:hypothetical protein
MSTLGRLGAPARGCLDGRLGGPLESTLPSIDVQRHRTAMARSDIVMVEAALHRRSGVLLAISELVKG